MPFERPNYTNVPNEVLGDRAEPGLMAEMGMAELKVLLAVCRVTFGFHRRTGGATLRQIQAMTGIANRRDVLSAAEKLADRDLVTRTLDEDGETLWTVLVEGDAEELVAAKPKRRRKQQKEDQPAPITI